LGHIGNGATDKCIILNYLIGAFGNGEFNEIFFGVSGIFTII